MQRLSRDALEAIVSSIPAGIVVIEKKNGKALYVNQRAIQLYGADPRGLEMKDYSTKLMKLLTLNGDIYPPEQLPASKALIAGQEAKDDLIIERPDGSRVIVSAFAKPIKDEKGKVIAAVGMFEDITERKKAQEALRESEQRYRTLVDTSTDAIVVHKDGRFVFANPAALELFGAKSFDELKGRSIFDFMVPEEQASVQTRIKKAQESQKIKLREEKIVRLDKTQVFVEATGAPIYYNGKRSILVIFHNISENKKFQQKLEEYTKNLEKLVEERTKQIRESEQSYRELYESFGEAFIATDWELNVIHWNKAAERVTTVAAKDALGKKIYKVLPEMATVNIEPYFEALAAKKPARFMMNVVSRETGKPSVFEISTYPSTQGIIIIVEDKTQEEQTKRLSTIGQTAGMVGHDIRNPLQAITGDVYLTKTELATLPESEAKTTMQENLHAIEQNIYYIDKIVADLQDYARPLTPTVQQTDLEQIIKPLLEKNVPKNIQAIYSIQAEANKIVADPDLLKRILSNLVTNAVQAMPDGGKLSINAYKVGNSAFITVEDTGVGISEVVKPNLFTPMFTTKSKGQGFGLAVVKRFTEALGGTITFESEEGKGTKFIIKLPAK